MTSTTTATPTLIHGFSHDISCDASIRVGIVFYRTQTSGKAQRTTWVSEKAKIAYGDASNFWLTSSRARCVLFTGQAKRPVENGKVARRSRRNKRDAKIA